MNVDWSALRPRMMSVAYRMLGSVADAEDAVQDAFLRLHTAADVKSPEGFLVKTTTRRCIDLLRANHHRQNYIGPWVPEPVDTKGGDPSSVLSESLAQAFLLLLERLSPEERAAYLLRTVFDYEYAEIADILDKSEVHVRQIVSRAKSRLERDKLRFRAARHQAEALAERFIAACRAGDVKQVEQLLTEEVEIHSDGGGKVVAARVVVRGRNLAARFMVGVFRKRGQTCDIQMTTVNGQPGMVFSVDGAPVLIASLHVGEGVQGVYMTNNPDKLSRWSMSKID